MNLKIVRFSERPDLAASLSQADLDSVWPEMMRHDATANLYFAPERMARFLDFAFLAYDDARPGVMMARGYSVPFCLGPQFERPALPDDGWDRAILWADRDAFAGRKPNAITALEITLHPTVAGTGFSSLMIAAMRENAARLGFTSLYAPVRPNRKHLEPHRPMADYACATREDGLPIDPWLRVHARAGARIVKIAPTSMTVAGTLAEWRAWTGLPFDRDGELVVPGALNPVHVSLAQDYAVYVEPNVWMEHRTR